MIGKKLYIYGQLSIRLMKLLEINGYYTICCNKIYSSHKPNLVSYTVAWLIFCIQLSGPINNRPRPFVNSTVLNNFMVTNKIYYFQLNSVLITKSCPITDSLLYVCFLTISLNASLFTASTPTLTGQRHVTVGSCNYIYKRIIKKTFSIKMKKMYWHQNQKQCEQVREVKAVLQYSL